MNVPRVAFVRPAGGAEALDVEHGGRHHPDAAAPHHAGDSSPPDPAQLHQPLLRRPGASPRRRERGLHGPASTIRHAGSSSFFFTPPPL